MLFHQTFILVLYLQEKTARISHNYDVPHSLLHICGQLMMQSRGGLQIILHLIKHAKHLRFRYAGVIDLMLW
jgi:hypothetical protein